ncbi:GTPase Obg-like isoform X2 [Dysidea avara]|uniref:GTPase Obg-like isoform X2 n=1 Tax=Dysidea avara TaxID=196820 RepID=UPI00331B9D68
MRVSRVIFGKIKVAKGKSRIEQRITDRKRVIIRSGRGGNGCVSYVSGKPDGGRGGRGGSVKFVSNKQVKDLSQLLHCYNAKHGGHGSSRGRCGKDGEDITVVVPTGTVVYKDGEELIDLDGDGVQYIGVVGGEGGQGNIINQDEDEWNYNDDGTDGEESTEVVLQLEMKLLADVGLVGFPNAGKSTLLGALSRARPKVASYPFTTLRPHLGIVASSDSLRTVTDIPGILPGAHRNVGLGLSFLRHIERCQVLLMCLDGLHHSMTLHEQFSALQYELDQYSRRSDFTTKPSAVIVNKMDEADPQFVVQLKETLTPRYPVLPISALKRWNILYVRETILSLCR